MIQDCFGFTSLGSCKNIRNPLIFFAKNGYLLIFFACQKIINSLASKLASNFYTFDTCIFISLDYTSFFYFCIKNQKREVKRPLSVYPILSTLHCYFLLLPKIPSNYHSDTQLLLRSEVFLLSLS